MAALSVAPAPVEPSLLGCMASRAGGSGASSALQCSAMDIFTLHKGTAPLLVSVPHDGTAVPDDIAARLTESARRVPDTDWHIARLYGFARELGASVLVPT